MGEFSRAQIGSVESGCLACLDLVLRGREGYRLQTFYLHREIDPHINTFFWEGQSRPVVGR